MNMCDADEILLLHSVLYGVMDKTVCHYVDITHLENSMILF